MKRLPVVIACAMLLTLNGTVPIQNAKHQRKLDALVQRGFTYTMLPDNMVELTNLFTGTKQLRSLREPSGPEIRSWAAQRGIPIMEIDPAVIDTMAYSGWYRFWTQVPASTPANDFPLIEDVNDNGLLENYGTTVDTVYPNAGYMRIYEVSTDGLSVLRHTYPPPPFPANATNITDINKNGLFELCIVNAQLHMMKFFEQPTKIQLPTALRFTFTLTQAEIGDPTMTPFFGNLDGDNATDCLYVISEPDSDSTGTIPHKIIVAEFDSFLNNMKRVWESPMPPKADLGFFTDAVTAGDFDGDGKTEFATTTAVLRPSLFIFENDGDNSYHLTFLDTIPEVTNYNNATVGDIDGDGKPEIFTTATISTGNWIFVHEADGNDHFSIKSIIHVLVGGTFDSPLYFAKDMDGDSRLELVFTAGVYLIILKADGDNLYSVWFVKPLPWQENILLSDFNHDGLIDFAVGKYAPPFPGARWVCFTDVWLRDKTTSILEARNMSIEHLDLECYPNPSNPNTTIAYRVPQRDRIRLLLYDVAGRLVRTLVDDEREVGSYSLVLDASAIASGVYFCQLQSSHGSLVKKFLFIH